MEGLPQKIREAIISLQGQATQHWDNVMRGADSTHRSTCVMPGLWADRDTVGKMLLGSLIFTWNKMKCDAWLIPHAFISDWCGPNMNNNMFKDLEDSTVTLSLDTKSTNHNKRLTCSQLKSYVFWNMPLTQQGAQCRKETIEILCLCTYTYMFIHIHIYIYVYSCIYIFRVKSRLNRDRKPYRRM